VEFSVVGGESMKKVLKGYFVAASVGAALVAAAPAEAGTRYDGTWHVTFATTSGDCDSNTGFNIQVNNGIVSGPFNARGRVTDAGRAQVAVSSGAGEASGTGRLRGRAGSGSWSASGSRGQCTGSWSASR
jgi:hypothetical protein